MRWPPLPWRRPPFPVGPGERLLAWAQVRQPDGGPPLVGGTRDALYLPARVPWEQVASADWDQEESTLRVVEVGRFGEPSPVHLLHLDDAGRLLQLVRERVTASIAVQRHVAVSGRRSVRILARRAPGSRAELAWFVEYDDGLDPADPRVDAVVQEALATARADVEV
ncbi:hypothetical protein KVF89_06945 [Nocardioides carbamazepini]|uniref:hypothetical protein n=1 Tax=Nocardioides carbamazepini TaxID=2854259 RepID=UPI00214A7996|nr:hypothetical protein [Nocardioides carbamazepini]MCR1782263.1 hypothetical protein [Nocardioides carbamazepini]